MLPFYLLHEPVIVAAAWLIVRWNAPILVKYLALVIVSFAGTLALYELFVRRFAISRRLAGMRSRPPTAHRPAPNSDLGADLQPPDPEAVTRNIAGVLDPSTTS